MEAILPFLRMPLKNCLHTRTPTNIFAAKKSDLQRTIPVVIKTYTSTAMYTHMRICSEIIMCPDILLAFGRENQHELGLFDAAVINNSNFITYFHNVWQPYTSMSCCSQHIY